jgi:hypothetical protein
MSKFFDIFGFLQLKELLNELQMELWFAFRSAAKHEYR